MQGSLEEAKVKISKVKISTVSTDKVIGWGEKYIKG